MLAMSEVAVRLGISLSMAHKLVRSGEIASYRFGRCRRVSELQLQTYIDGCLIEEPDTIATRTLKYF
jgi:excisionase family DNA binding protein